MESHVSCIIAMQISSCIFCRFQLGGIKFGGRCGSTSPANPIYTIFGSEFGSVFFFTQNNLVVLRDLILVPWDHKLGNARWI